MLLNDSTRVERCCPRRWSLLAVGALLSLAILLSGVGFARTTEVRPLEQPKEPSKDVKEQPKKKDDEPKKEKDPEEKFVRPQRGFQPPAGDFDPEQFQKRMQQMQGVLGAVSGGSSGPGGTATQQAMGMMYGMLTRQAMVLSYIDNFRLLAFLCVLCIPATLLFKRVKARKAAAAAMH